MSNARYLEVDSTYRNRKEWPLAADFVVPISQTGRKGRLDAVDPVSHSAIEYVWRGDAFNDTSTGAGTGTPLTVTLVEVLPAAATGLTPPLYNTNGTSIVIVESVSMGGGGTGVTMQREENYYALSVLREFVVAPALTAEARVLHSIYMGTVQDTGSLSYGRDRMRLVLNTAAWATVLPPTNPTLELWDPTDFASISAPWLFIPSGRLQLNGYQNAYFHNQTQSQTRPLRDYQDLTHLARIDTTKSASATKHSGPIQHVPALNPWGVDDTYSIRQAVPLLCDDLTGAALTPLLTIEGLDYVPGVAPNHTSFNFNINLVHEGCNYAGDFLEILTDTQFALTGGPVSATVIDLIPLVPAATAPNNAFKGYSITLQGDFALLPAAEAVGEKRTITEYDGLTGLATVSPGFSIIITAATNFKLVRPQEARRIVKYVDYRSTGVVGGGGLFIDFIVTASSLSGFYRGLYISFPGPRLRLITDYVVTTNSVTGVTTRRAFLSSNVAVGLTAFTITSGITGDPFSYVISQGAIAGTTFQPLPPALTFPLRQAACVLPFTRDNLTPFVYTGSLTSQQDMVCYEIELLNLVLPNATLDVGGGGNIAFYPYVYVELSNVSASGAHLKNIIYSNNPNATRVLFRAAIDDVPNLTSSSFIKIDGDGAVQTVKFKPNDDLRFRVTLQNGVTFETILDERFSPQHVNPLAQISAYFSLKRL